MLPKSNKNIIYSWNVNSLEGASRNSLGAVVYMIVEVQSDTFHTIRHTNCVCPSEGAAMLKCEELAKQNLDKSFSYVEIQPKINFVCKANNILWSKVE